MSEKEEEMGIDIIDRVKEEAKTPAQVEAEIARNFSGKRLGGNEEPTQKVVKRKDIFNKAGGLYSGTAGASA